MHSTTKDEIETKREEWRRHTFLSPSKALDFETAPTTPICFVRRKSCSCSECGNVSGFQYYAMNVKLDFRDFSGLPLAHLEPAIVTNQSRIALLQKLAHFERKSITKEKHVLIQAEKTKPHGSKAGNSEKLIRQQGAHTNNNGDGSDQKLLDGEKRPRQWAHHRKLLSSQYGLPVRQIHFEHLHLISSEKSTNTCRKNR